MWLKEEVRSTAGSRFIVNQRGQGILDTLLVCILVGILIGTVIPYYQRLAQEAREAALQMGLVNIRKGVELYQVIQGHYPPDLKSLVHVQFIIPAREDTFFSGEYLRHRATDRAGNLLDPFGNRYQYDPSKGTVVSGTKGYESW